MNSTALSSTTSFKRWLKRFWFKPHRACTSFKKLPQSRFSSWARRDLQCIDCGQDLATVHHIHFKIIVFIDVVYCRDITQLHLWVVLPEFDNFSCGWLETNVRSDTKLQASKERQCRNELPQKRILGPSSSRCASEPYGRSFSSFSIQVSASIQDISIIQLPFKSLKPLKCFASNCILSGQP